MRCEDEEGILWSSNDFASSHPIIGTPGNTRVSGSSAGGRTCSSFWDKPFTCNSLPGLTLGLWIPGLAWNLPKPILRVQPESVVSKHTNVTLLCEGARGAKQYRLYKLGSPSSWPMNSKIPLEPGNKAEFSISKVESHHAGLYHCYYHTRVGWSEDSESQELVVTGIYSKPRLSVQPSPIATPGENVTLQCVSKQKYDRFILTKEGPQKLSWMLDSWYNNLTRQFQALFSVGPVTISQRWIFRCYSYRRSEPQV